MKNKTEKLSVFLCHGSEDKNVVRRIYLQLKSDGFAPWLDEKNILPGQDWDIEIRNAIKRSHAILICLSSNSISKEGYVQKEIKFALDVADEKPEGTIFLIPVRLDNCEIYQRLSHWQWVNFFDGDGYEQIVKALAKRANECGLDDYTDINKREPLLIETTNHEYSGTPYYDIVYEAKIKFLFTKEHNLVSHKTLKEKIRYTVSQETEHFHLQVVDVKRILNAPAKDNYIKEIEKAYENSIRKTLIKAHGIDIVNVDGNIRTKFEY